MPGSGRGLKAGFFGNRARQEKEGREMTDNTPEQPDNIVPENIVPETESPQNIVPENIVPETESPQNIVPENIVPENIVPEDES
jgi:hypothetical protein